MPNYIPTSDTPNIKENAIYQIVAPGTRKRYVRVSEVHGEKPCACEVFHDHDKPETVGSMISVDPTRLCVPDQYPSSRFRPEIWRAKVTQSAEAKQAEIASLIKTLVQVKMVTASGLPEQDKKTVGAIRDLLKDKIGGFTLALFLGFVTKKIMETLPKSAEKEPISFKQKISQMHNDAAKKAAHEANDAASRQLQKNREVRDARMLQNANHQGIV